MNSTDISRCVARLDLEEEEEVRESFFRKIIL